jgi:hypothetical protein
VADAHAAAVLGLTCSSEALRSLSELSTKSPEGVYDTLC